MIGKRPRGLAKVVKALKFACAAVNAFAPGIRKFVPDPSKADFDSAVTAVNTACDIIRAIDYLDEAPGTNPPWGEQSAVLG